jgi:type I restriction enzyme M protein
MKAYLHGLKLFSKKYQVSIHAWVLMTNNLIRILIMSEDEKKRLEQQLWNIANTLRGKMDADEFRDYILGFIFYKYLSEKLNHYADELLVEDGIRYLELNENTDKYQEFLDYIKDQSIKQLGYFLKPSELFSQLVMRGNGDTNNFILEDLTNVLKQIQQSTMGHESEDDFENLFEDLDLTSTKLGKTEQAKNTLISKVLSHLDKIDFDLKNHDRDVLGDAYEYLIGQFASGAGKKAGEFYTPQQVSKILSKLVTVGKTRLKSAYDPTCGSGSLLLRIAKAVENVSNFYGQELNRTTYNLARMNMIIHGVHYREFDLRQEDTLEQPQHIDKRFEAIVANPPFSAHWSANPLHLSDDRFSQYGQLAPKTKADFAFVQHMIYQLDDNGTMAIVLPHGVLFRGAAEGHIRKYLIENKNYLDAVIGLPANIFYGTSIPTCILVFKKCREDSEHILFIDASNEFEKVKAQNYLTDENVDKIIKTFTDRMAIDKYSYLANLEEVKENDYNLNIPRYVDTFEEEELIDLDLVSKELKELDIEMKKTDSEIANYCHELGIDTPF